ncbi:GNAT family N-acetyltransferase [Planobispora siamensis]|uniref:N-acetyltransferase n=1 Tax=Planobispora siamensis TaxID=936338 RepID=A0A8J3SJE9_9ACTN|nr:GNAT family N-acetyltransferase [Planobispora siamensis]GIH93505.1 N-acetyltransferase [Planobispora siamensis]
MSGLAAGTGRANGLAGRIGGAGEPAAEVRLVGMEDPAVAPLLAGLDLEYTSRYGPNDELGRYPAGEFAPPHGAFLILVADGETVAGGAFRRYDAVTAELKRVWTHPHRRRSGLGRLMVRELERHALRLGYRRVYLTTGPRQPEAAALYLAAGYTPRFDVDDRPAEGPLAFVKDLDHAS